MPNAVLQINNLTLGYRAHPAVHHLTGTLAPGSLTALVGANGSGKSTLMKGIAGLLKPITGSITIQPGTRLAYLPQQSELDRSFPVQVQDLVALGLWSKRGIFKRYQPEDKVIIRTALEAVGLQGFEKRSLDTLSGGQFQRVLFARVLVQDADLILLDEPFNAIDMNTLETLLNLIQQWHQEGRSVVVVVHNLDIVRQVFPETLLLARELIAWGPTKEVLTAANIARLRQQPQGWQADAPWCPVNELPGGRAGSVVHGR